MNNCVCCGSYIPEGEELCPLCYEEMLLWKEEQEEQKQSMFEELQNFREQQDAELQKFEDEVFLYRT